MIRTPSAVGARLLSYRLGRIGPCSLARIAATSAAVAATPARSTKIALIADCLREAEPDEVVATVAYLSGELLQRRTGVGWASLRDLPAPATEPSLTVAEVDRVFETVAGAVRRGLAGPPSRAVTELMSRATAQEQQLLRGLVAGELRQGALASLVTDAVAKAAGLPADAVRHAVMLRGEVGPVAAAALADGAAGLTQFGLVVGRPVQPMLAQTAESVAAALERIGTAAVEWKLDGVRVQIHRWGATPPTCASSPGPSTTSPSGCRSWSRRRCPSRSSRWCWTARRSPCTRTGGRDRSSRPAVGWGRAPTSRGHGRSGR